MKTINLLDGQSLIDVAIQEYGSIEGLLQLCKDNELLISQQMVAGSSIKIDETAIKRPQLVSYLKRNAVRVVTALGHENIDDDGIFDETFDETFE